MTRFLFTIFVKPISYLPFSVLYFISDILNFIVYRVIGYRVKVVRANLKNSFADKSEEELLKIERGFYRHFTDFLVENIKLLTISKKELFERCTIGDISILEKYKDRNLALVAGHYSNWEYVAAAINSFIDQQVVCIYSPLKNEHVNNQIKKSRGICGMELLPKQEVNSYLGTGFKDEKKALIFAADQSPTFTKKVVWTEFLHQETAVFYGPEIISKRLDMVVLYLKLGKTSRGQFTIDIELIEDKPKATNFGDITEKHVRLLERDIMAQPECWLWSHKRWKRTKTAKEVLIKPRAVAV
ncbi:lysophospholipid acyltransferase family protein [Flammeovirga kamogawensis]|uniref:Lipid A biosynthesis acyltransferase n=1 Tax=Flammeovirga kamogawensis TaxID=373891 RepID=A0ABX8GZ44_9BACT|nr:hypothetical protein [Flammeovirga kamogawensis]MBB6459119.1 KDO2-lipid IV(A) lauroyltransferase [Flammeovirga kamogawensis]QWG08688.1 lipid A biosynthesis acyltransferase [Flammeovirga kamogawensis]TRX66981.1 hypothetical protein EO216_02090 [Flammeovirga kamogawensis]